MDLGSTTPPLGMSKEGEMPEYLLNSRMLKLFTAESGFGGKSHHCLSLASVNQFYSFLIYMLRSPNLQLGDTLLSASCH